MGWCFRRKHWLSLGWSVRWLQNNTEGLQSCGTLADGNTMNDVLYLVCMLREHLLFNYVNFPRTSRGPLRSGLMIPSFLEAGPPKMTPNLGRSRRDLGHESKAFWSSDIPQMKRAQVRPSPCFKCLDLRKFGIPVWEGMLGETSIFAVSSTNDQKSCRVR